MNAIRKKGLNKMIKFGFNKFRKEESIVWDANKVVNGHFIIVGSSGTGKTYTIRKILRELTNNPKADIHVLDVHGDIDIGDDLTSTVSFSETADYGLNPLKISANKDFGGVRKKIRSFISMINRTTRALGSKQESVMMHLLNDLYYDRGFFTDDWRSWDVNVDIRNFKPSPKRNPTIEDLRKYCNTKLKEIMIGTGSKSIQALEALNKRASQLEGSIKKKGRVRGNETETDKVDAKIDKLKATCKDLYSDYISQIETGRELDQIMKYDSAEVLKSVFEKISNLESTGIFKSSSPDFEAGKPIKRYNIKSLNKDEQKMFVDILLEDIYLAAKERGEQDGVNTFLVIDEAHIFVSPEDEHIINVISKEARKFGVGLILASQAFNHFTEDIIANSSTKIILGIDEMFQDVSAKKLKIDVKRFNYIVPHKSAIVQIKKKGDLSNKFVDCVFDDK